ncbi:hypothetical protein QU408_06745 [Lactobacillus crispatus]|uniref:hypothetical protein n=1 Tax=Lactobacillus crispatus TaxID=47770 RepID=UPI003D6B252E
MRQLRIQSKLIKQKKQKVIITEEKINPFGGDYTGLYTGVGGTYLKHAGSKENPDYAGQL